MSDGHPSERPSPLDGPGDRTGQGPGGPPNDLRLLSELLFRWEEMRQKGQEIAVASLCADRPDLVGRLERMIQGRAPLPLPTQVLPPAPTVVANCWQWASAPASPPRSPPLPSVVPATKNDMLGACGACWAWAPPHAANSIAVADASSE